MLPIFNYFRKLNFRHRIYISLSIPLIIWSYFVITYIIYDKTFLKMYSILKLIIFIPFLFVAYTLWIFGNNQTPMPGGELKYDNCFHMEDKNIIAAYNAKCAIHNEVRGVTDIGSVVDSLYNTAYGVLLIGLLLTLFSKKEKSVGSAFRQKWTFFILLITILGLTFQSIDDYGPLTVIFYYGLSVLTPMVLSAFLFLCISMTEQLKYR